MDNLLHCIIKKITSKKFNFLNPFLILNLMLKYAFGNYDKFHIIRFLSAPNWHLRPLSPMAVE